MDFFLFVIGFVIIIKCAQWLVQSASRLARSFGVSSLVIGLSIVALGTSAPELAIGIVSGIQHTNQVVFGSIVGSSIANIALIIGSSALIRSLIVDPSVIRKELPISLAAQLFLLILVWIGDGLSQFDGLLLLLCFFSYMAFLFLSKRKEDALGAGPREQIEYEYTDESCQEVEYIPTSKKAVLILIIALCFAGLYLGGELVVSSSVAIARSFGWSESLIGVTLVAFGTSLPELITSITAVLKMEDDIAIGNILGSNIFNVLMILGVSSTIYPIKISGNEFFDLFVLLGLSLMLFLFSFKFKKIHRSVGFGFLLIYVAFIFYKIVSI